MDIQKILILTVCAASFAGCSNKTVTGPTDTTTTTKPPPKVDTIAVANWGLILPDTSTFYGGTHSGKLTAQVLSSASGIGASRAYPGMFWIENDQGAPNVAIYLVDTTGAVRADYSVVGASNRDWTDMTIGPGPAADTTYVYIADIGDSPGNHAYSIIYRFPEPNQPIGTTELFANTARAAQIKFKYPDGPRDAETILIDPQSKDIYIVDKNINGNLYELPYPQSTDTLIVATKLLENLHFGPWRCGAIGANRRDIFLKGYQSIIHWSIDAGQSILSAMFSQPLSEPYNMLETRGEAFCLTPNDSEYWTVSKYSTTNYAYLNRYKRK